MTPNSNNSSADATNPKVIAIVAHLTIIGCLAAIFMNLDNKDRFAGFYIKQTFGIHLLFYALAYFVGFFDSWMISGSFFVCAFILWLYSFLGAVSSELKLIPILGESFQKWFNKLSA